MGNMSVGLGKGVGREEMSWVGNVPGVVTSSPDRLKCSERG